MNIDTTGNKPLVILSATVEDNTPDAAMRNALRNQHLRAELSKQGFEYGKCTGCYKGVEERSWIVEYEGCGSFDALLNLAAAYGQESILTINRKREAAIWYLDPVLVKSLGQRIVLGKIEPVSERQAKKLDAWTRTENNGQYYAVKES